MLHFSIYLRLQHKNNYYILFLDEFSKGYILFSEEF
jgi:hypothetical protein